ncbi:hypothetical protein JXA84_07430 [candidate division WOR-3 bacterium]|nr:hypothetical protein [candidate division WOR-3 bacterium]
MHLITLIPIFVLSWAPAGNFTGGQLSPAGFQVALLQNGEIGILEISTGAWKTLPVPGPVTQPLAWSRDSKFIAVAIETEGAYAFAVLNVEDGSSFTSQKSGMIRSISWDATGEYIAVSSQNNSASVPCTTYVYQFIPVENKFAPILIFPARDPYFLSDGNIACLAGNHLPPVRAGNRKPYSFTKGYVFILTLEGNLTAKIELFDDPCIWQLNIEGECVYSAGNKIYYAQISSSGKTSEILLSLQNALISSNLMSSLMINLGNGYVYSLWEIGSTKMLSAYNPFDPSYEKIILTGLNSISTVFENPNVCVLSGDAKKGIYDYQGNFILSFSGEPTFSAENIGDDLSESYSLSIQCSDLPDLFATIETLDKSTISFLPTVSTPAYQIRVTRFISAGQSMYKIHLGSFNDSAEAESHVQEIQQLTGKTVAVENE